MKNLEEKYLIFNLFKVPKSLQGRLISSIFQILFTERNLDENF